MISTRRPAIIGHPTSKVWPGGIKMRSPVADMLRGVREDHRRREHSYQRFPCVLFSVVFMRLDHALKRGLAGLTEVILVRRASSLALVFGVANAALFADANFSAYSRNIGLGQGF
jgi:hypothetical protein